MIRARWSSITILFVYIGGTILLLLIGDELTEAHLTGFINYFASDASVFYEHYSLLKHESLLDNHWVFLRGTPIILMWIFDGNLILVSFLQLTLTVITLRVACDRFNTKRGRILFILLSLVFPYFSISFMSLNKEIFVMCSAVFFASYISCGLKRHLIIALILAAIGRFYMLAALLVLVFMAHRVPPIRYGRILFSLLVFTIIAPFASVWVPGFQSEGLLEQNTGRMAPLLAMVVDSFGYFIIYPIKYLLIIPSRAYGYFFAGNSHDLTGAMVSIASLIMLSTALWLWLNRNKLSFTVKLLIVCGFTAPIPILWTELVHWRYYSFVYFFFLFALITHLEERRALRHKRMTVGL